MKVLVTGSRGQLGSDVCKELETRGIPYCGVSTRECDITDAKAVDALLESCRPDAVIHCAAYTAVEKAESEQERCRQVNADGTRSLALACRRTDAKLLYISTDYVFSGEGDQPHRVDDPTGPLNVYGETKLAGEQAVRELLEHHWIVRTSWVFGNHGSNFVKTMLRLGAEREEVRVVDDQVGSPTYTGDLAKLLCDMAVGDKYGTYHAANAGFCSWAEFAREIFRMAGLPTRVLPVSTAEYPSKAVRPMNSRLDQSALQKAGFQPLPHWKDALNVFFSRA